MERILVALPNWYGETLFATPFLRGLRQQVPRAIITVMGWPQCEEVLRHNPHVNAFLIYDERNDHRSVMSKWRLIRRLREIRCDTAFILRRSLSRSLLLAAAGIPTRVGFDNPKSGWLLTRRVPSPNSPMHKAATYLPLLEAWGAAAPTTLTCDYVVTQAERAQAGELLSARGIGNDRFVVLHPGANWAHKRWAPKRFAALADRVVETHRVQVLVTGGPHDLELAETVKRGMRHPAVVLAGRTTLRQLSACLEHATVVISNDTGVLHLAAALGRAVLGLYGPTSPALTGPLGEPSRTAVLHHADCCPEVPCYHPDTPPHQGMDAISVDEAYIACSNLLRQCGMRSSEFGMEPSG